ncbi:mannose-specific lectin 3-like [Phalaenopsis equestris]|uniref:mannose-specific lectin 3-like n=1 Tax=Phalaenopsis equestris TaxID=78828 RepID=UPI0009E1FF26|nr:mannose-specific lectin 3-like [Phalaenopsis equestris]
MALPIPLLLSIISLILLPSPSAANEGNILATGDVLPTNGQLSYKKYAFVIQDDCNLVLYNGANGFQSNTHGAGFNCTLSLSGLGELVIKSGDGSHVWSSPGGIKQGNYVAVLGPDGLVKVFGPSIWSTPELSSSSAAIEAELSTVPSVRNLLFSSDVLQQNFKLESRDYTLELTDVCNLEFRKASVGVVWESGTKGEGQNCFVRFNNRGRLAVVNGKFKVLWLSKPVGDAGDYVLVVQINGQAVIYGPVVWSAGS